MDEIRIIDTGVWASGKAMDCFHSVIGQMSDGIWENTKGYDGYWIPVEIGISRNKVTIEVSKRYKVRYCREYIRNKYYGMSDAEVLKFFKNKMRAIVRIAAKDNLEESQMTEEQWHHYYSGPFNPTPRHDYSWKKGNGTELVCMSYENTVTVGDVVSICEDLKNKMEEK